MMRRHGVNHAVVTRSVIAMLEKYRYVVLDDVLKMRTISYFLHCMLSQADAVNLFTCMRPAASKASL